MDNLGERVKKGLKCCWEDGCKGCPYEENCQLGDGGSDLAGDTLEYIRGIEEKKAGWISVKDDLPPKEERVYVVTQQWNVTVGKYCYRGAYGAEWFKCGKSTIACLYWMPIPELPFPEG